MRAVVIEQYDVMPTITDLPIPRCRPDGVVVRVEATGLCRSDWHGWQGHDADITLPHVPGHEIAGTISQIGAEVSGWSVGDRVTVPFVCACGRCEQCSSGNQQVCLNQQQPGFTYDGSFAEYVAIPFAATNLVALPDELSFVAAAGLGCRFATAFRGITGVGAVQPGEWLAVFGCGGVGLSAVMIAAALDAKVIAIDTNPAALTAAVDFLNAQGDAGKSVVAMINSITYVAPGSGGQLYANGNVNVISGGLLNSVVGYFTSFSPTVFIDSNSPRRSAAISS